MEFILSGLFLALTVSSHKLLILRWLAWMSASVIATKFIFSLFSLLLRLQCGLYFLCYCSFRWHMAAQKVKFCLKRKLKFCHYLHTVMSFQSCMTFFCELIILKLKCKISVPNRIKKYNPCFNRFPKISPFLPQCYFIVIYTLL